MKLNKLFLVFVICVLLLLAGGWWISRHRETDTAGDTVIISATFYPLAHFAQHVGGDLVSVHTIVPAGSEPHDFEPSPRDIAAIHNSQLFLVNGAGMDQWAQEQTAELEAAGVSVITMSNVLENDGQYVASDPHFWLDPVLAQKEVRALASALVAVDPTHAATYTQNSENYIAQLANLDQQYQQSLQHCRIQDIVVSHDAFGYLARRYHFSIIPITGISPEEEPSPKTMGEIATLVQEKHIQYIFFETLVSPKLAETIAREVGAQTAILDPIEGVSADDQKNGKTYVSIMEENLQQLRNAMACE
ncbi:MAG: zinc ABC transporter substrate-binding protein [Candidatus Kerfeldbacteria bacterium]|nr:zinc ABC transporter substrate-binding protein [Candidatus Kerfeldbacteria bacterium]